MSRILLLEDHALLRNAMAQALSQIRDVDILAVGTLQAAKEALNGPLPDLLVSDLNMPDGSGLELIAYLRDEVDVPVIFVSGYVPKHRAQLWRHPGVTVRAKPLPLEELQRIAVAHMQGGAWDGVPFTARDYVHIACMGGHSVSIEVEASGASGVRGSIIVRAGRPWSAHAGSLRGLSALQELDTTHGRTRCFTYTQEFEARNLPDERWEHLVSFTEPGQDTAQRGIPRPPRLSATNTANTAAKAEPRRFGPRQDLRQDPQQNGFDHELECGADALLRRDYVVALRAYERAYEFQKDDKLVAANIARLKELINHDIGSQNK